MKMGEKKQPPKTALQVFGGCFLFPVFTGKLV